MAFLALLIVATVIFSMYDVETRSMSRKQERDQEKWQAKLKDKASSSKTCTCPKPQPRTNDPHCMLCNRRVVTGEVPTNG